jgi:very-short-patch-repair endonuclease
VEHVDARISAVAGEQWGYVRRDQLKRLGLGRGAIDHRIATGRLTPRHHAVYAVGHVPRAWEADAMAAVLALGPRAVLAGRSAAVLWGVLPEGADARKHVAAPSPRLGPRPGLHVHRLRRLEPSMVTRHRGVPVLTPLWVVVQLADSEPEADVVRALGQFELDRRLTRGALLEARARWRSHRGAPLLLRELGDDLPAPTASMLEDRFRELLQAAALPRPAFNARVCGVQVDCLWPEHGVIVELDGRRFHDARFEADRARDARLAAAGHRVLRFSWARLKREPYACIAELSAVLSRPLGRTGAAA